MTIKYQYHKILKNHHYKIVLPNNIATMIKMYCQKNIVKKCYL